MADPFRLWQSGDAAPGRGDEVRVMCDSCSWLSEVVTVSDEIPGEVPGGWAAYDALIEPWREHCIRYHPLSPLRLVRRSGG